MREDFFYFLRELFNSLNFDLVPSNRIEEDALAALKKVRELFNRDLYSIELEEFDQIKEELELVQAKMQLFQGLSDKAKMN